MKLFFITFSLILSLSTFTQAAENARFQITLLEDRKSTNVVFTGGNTCKNASIFRMQFKVLDESIKKLDFAKIYFFNDKKEMVDTLIPSKKTFLNQGHTITDLTNLDKNKLYNIEFIYQSGEIKWKYAIAILGTKSEVVAYTKPQGQNAADFDFPEKAYLVR